MAHSKYLVLEKSDQFKMRKSPLTGEISICVYRGDEWLGWINKRNHMATMMDGETTVHLRTAHPPKEV